MDRLLDKPLDKVTDAFNGVYGEMMSKKTKERIHWILNEVKGFKVLDIGCSQGITSILLGREGKNVIGLDSLNESINFAKHELSKEEESTQKNVMFLNENIITTDRLDLYEKFDTIIIGEVLEHLGDGDSLLEKVHSLGSENCIYIITVPFGINDYFDHKKTYYYSQLYQQINKKFEIQQVKFLKKWIGVVAIKKIEESNSELSFSIEEITKLEKNFYEVERGYLNSNKRLKEKLEQSKISLDMVKEEFEKYKRFNEDNIVKKYNELKEDVKYNNHSLKEFINQYNDDVNLLKENLIVEIENSRIEYEKIIDNHKEYIKSLELEKEHLQQEKEAFIERNDTSNQIIEKYKVEANIYKSKLIEQKKRTVITRKEKIKEYEGFIIEQNKNIELLEKIKKENKDLKKKYEKLEQKHKLLERRYEALSNSKLGKMTLELWKRRKGKEVN